MFVWFVWFVVHIDGALRGLGGQAESWTVTAAVASSSFLERHGRACPGHPKAPPFPEGRRR